MNYKEKMSYLFSKQEKVLSAHLLSNRVVTSEFGVFKNKVDSYLSWKAKGMDLLAATPMGFHCLLSASFISSLSARRPY